MFFSDITRTNSNYITMKKILMLATFMIVAVFVQASSKDYYVNDEL